MTAVWMLYCLAIGVAFCVMGYALERGLQYAGRPTRWAWLLALFGSCLIPVAAWLRPDAFATFAAPIPIAAESPPTSSTLVASVTATTLAQQTRPFSLSDLDEPLRWAWGGASLAVILTIITAATRLVALRRRWRTASIDGREVLISSNVGPAVVGLWSPRIVLPEWALQLPAKERELMLAHEEQHARAGDPAVIAMGFVLVLLAPWNVLLWWQWRRLRLAVEIDCDARVLAQGRSAPAYGELLIRVGQRRSPRLLGAATFGEPASFLESRIRRMVARMPRWRWLGAAVAGFLAIGAIVAACQTPRPLAPADSSGREFVGQLPQGQFLRAAIERYARQSSVRSTLPSLLEPSGPPMDVFLVADAKLEVYRSSVATLYYLGTARPASEIGVDDLKSAAPFFNPGSDGWLVVDPRALRGLVRDNVRVIWIHHDPTPQDTAVTPQTRQHLSEQHVAGELVRRLARRYHPEMFGQTGSQIAIALVLDSHENVVAHAARAGEARTPDGLYTTGESCLEVLWRLIPQYAKAQWSQSGCAGDTQRNVIVYWAKLLQP